MGAITAAPLLLRRMNAIAADPCYSPPERDSRRPLVTRRMNATAAAPGYSPHERDGCRPGLLTA